MSICSKNNDSFHNGLSSQNNHIEDIGFKALAEALKRNKSLKELDFGWAHIEDIGCKALAETLKERFCIADYKPKYDKPRDKKPKDKKLKTIKRMSRYQYIQKRKKEFLIFLQSISNSRCNLFLPTELKMIIWEKLISINIIITVV